LSAFHKIIATVRSALERNTDAAPLHSDNGALLVPSSSAARRAELTAQFGHELERVGGHFFGSITITEARERAATIAQESKTRSVIVGAGVSINEEPIAKALARNGIEVIRPNRVKGGDRAAIRDRVANCDLGFIEADYAIAATGTFCIVATAQRPSSLTILPPTNFIVVAADRILPTLADVIVAVGPERFATHRVALITGPSRTADIEKLIVIGVHGPKTLYAAIITQQF
jgi:L-lactate dehydrogenase complex protein LldG